MQQRIQSNTQTVAQITTAYISHGGGPLPLLEMQSKGDGESPTYHAEMINVLKGLSIELRKPDVIILVSAHWEEKSTLYRCMFVMEQIVEQLTKPFL